MSTTSTTTMTAGGNVVIPKNVRNNLGLRPGDKFVVSAAKGAIVLKSVRRPSMRDFDELVEKSRQAAKEAGLTRADVAKAVAAARGRK